MKIKIPENHLLKISYVGEFMIITSIAECIEEGCKPEIEYNWFDIENLPSDDYVPGVKELIPKAIAMNKHSKL